MQRRIQNPVKHLRWIFSESCCRPEAYSEFWQTFKIKLLRKYTFFYKQRFFSTQPQCCLTFAYIELQMLLRCCLIHVTINILRQIWYLAHLCPCLGLGLFMVYFCDLLFIFSLNFIAINHTTSLKQKYIFKNISYCFGW